MFSALLARPALTETLLALAWGHDHLLGVSSKAMATFR
jgi:hypothetical protein